MIVLQDGSLSNVWKEAKALHKLNPENSHTQIWNGRRQSFWWANHIIHEYGPNGRLKQEVHVVVCEEEWEEVDKKGAIVTWKSRHAWLSSEPLSHKNVHTRCNLMGRKRSLH
jgi:hypothetical protein